MKATIIFALVQLILAMLVGMVLISQLLLNANTTGALNGTAGTVWNNMVAMIWVAVGIMALFPLVLIGLSIMGVFGGGGRET
jgi:hypothetical protein